MLRHKCLYLLFIFLSFSLYAKEIIIAKKNIAYNTKITLDDIQQVSHADMKKYCKPMTYNDMKEQAYISNRYIKKGTVICKDDISIYKKNSVIFNFGFIEIERNGKLIFENDEYIKIKKEDGKIEKIYKDGRVE